MTITGTSNIPLDLVVVADKQWSSKQLGLSGDHGIVEFDDICAGTELIFSKAGYITQSQIVEDPEDKYTIMLSGIGSWCRLIAPVYRQSNFCISFYRYIKYCLSWTYTRRKKCFHCAMKYHNVV